VWRRYANLPYDQTAYERARDKVPLFRMPMSDFVELYVYPFMETEVTRPEEVTTRLDLLWRTIHGT